MGPSVDSVVIDGSTVPIRLDRRDHEHAVLSQGDSDGSSRDSVLMLPPARAGGPSGGVTVREIIVDGWRIVVEIESARRAALRERAQTTQGDGAKAGPTEIRATIPGRLNCQEQRAGSGSRPSGRNFFGLCRFVDISSRFQQHADDVDSAFARGKEQGRKARRQRTFEFRLCRQQR